jgi:hypothetical protein
MDGDFLNLTVCLYAVGQNLNRAYRTCEFFGVRRLLTCQCKGDLGGNLFKASGRVEIADIADMPLGEGVLYLETDGDIEVSEVDWSEVHTVCIGGETRDFTSKKFRSARKAAISRIGHVSGLTVEAALSIALHEAMKSAKRISRIDTVGDFQRWREQRRVYSDRGIEFPVLNAVLVNRDLVQANDYNPNHVAKDKMELLRTSIVENGFCYGIASIFDPEINKFIIIDGDHRNQIAGAKWLNFAYVPLVIRDHPLEKRLAATVQFNKARGVHKIDLNAELVRRLIELGVSEQDICKQLGIDADELLRMKRNTKIADIYKELQFSKSWEVDVN